MTLIFYMISASIRIRAKGMMTSHFHVWGQGHPQSIFSFNICVAQMSHEFDWAKETMDLPVMHHWKVPHGNGTLKKITQGWKGTSFEPSISIPKASKSSLFQCVANYETWSHFPNRMSGAPSSWINSEKKKYKSTMISFFFPVDLSRIPWFQVDLSLILVVWS